ncbi:Fic family protein [archaeon]|jgi:Fic family protein|nr:Fic family protein [archaeon]MBT3465047.1 Fic family protein [archaeon]MBT6869280.1 Fic family protein [archaeon]MBT7193678.1 Fic family protein [archaeon]MBT7381210.1 Fic family protein [archaeon]
MTYVEIIKRNKKEYYYVTKNIRISNNKWKKVRSYLGDKKPTKKDIFNAAKDIEGKIKELGLDKDKSPYRYLNEIDAELLQDLKKSYKSWLDSTPESIKNKTNENFMIRFTYNSNAIEGNRLTLRQTALILKDKVIPSGVTAGDYNEAINGRECLDYIKEYNKSFSKSLLLKINEILTKNTDVVYGGRIRFFPVEIQGSDHNPPGEKEVLNHVNNMMKWFSKNKNSLHPFELAVILHHKLAWIHPFEDGNGRTARTVMNFILSKKGFPMFFIPFDKREEYYSALEEADKENYTKYVSMMLKLVVDQVKSYGHKKEKK